MPLPTTPLPPGYSWGTWGQGDHTQQNRPVIIDSGGNKLPPLMTADQIWSQYNQATGGGLVGAGTPLTLQQLSSVGNVQEGQRLADEASLNDMQGEFDAIPDTLRTLYSNAAKKAGTASETSEFKAGLNSEVNQGSRGAQAALGARMAAVYNRLGRPLPAHLQQYQKGPEQTVDNNVDNTQSSVDPDKGQATADDSVAESPEASAPADTQNAVAKVGTTDQDALAAKLKAMQKLSGSL